MTYKLEFKKWLIKNEMMSPGGGNTQAPAPSGETIAKDAMRTGSGGAFQKYDDEENPPSSGDNPLLAYLPKHTIKKVKMKKKMKKR